ncbi:MAG: hypothetical protein KIIPBIDF_01943 [Candidatus Methanoperedenaceae archaeon GB50]|nr:MAG: hypothetical protein KIIPBIDF_01943 [Candidatus Methanoperedenaceae archaeon GB50]
MVGPGSGTKANVYVNVCSDSTLSLTLKNNIIGLFQNTDEGYDLEYRIVGNSLT